MKKIILLFTIPYLLVVGIVFYLFFGPGVITTYETLQWKEIDTMVPVDGKIKIYQSQGWEVYSLRKSAFLIKIALKPAMDVAGLPSFSQKLLYRESAGPGQIYYIANPHKNLEVVYARTVGDTTLYFSAASPSLFTSLFIMDKITGRCFYKGEKVTQLTSSSYNIPLKCYLTDYIFVGSMTLPVIIMFFIFSFSGKKPSERYFIEDPVRLEESYIYYTMIRGFRRKGNFGYLVLTSAGRLRMFTFMKHIWTIDLYTEKPNLTIVGNTIILQREKGRFVLRSGKIREWQEALSSFSIR
jgi:hypothetical protein